MQHLTDWLGKFAPYLALAVLLATIVVAINILGKRLERHAEWLAMLDLRVDNLHKDKKATWARELQLGVTEKAPLVPPPLPPRAPTIDATDWRDDESVTESLLTRQTGRYPAGVPPKGPNDDDTTT